MISSSTCTLRVTATDGDVARGSVRRHQVSVGRPIEFDEASPRIAALEYAVRRIWGGMLDRLPPVCTLRAVVRLDLPLMFTA